MRVSKHSVVETLIKIIEGINGYTQISINPHKLRDWAQRKCSSQFLESVKCDVISNLPSNFIVHSFCNDDPTNNL